MRKLPKLLVNKQNEKHPCIKTFRSEVINILSTYSTSQAEQLATVKNWLGYKGLQFLEALTNDEKGTYNTLEWLFETLTNKFKPQFYETIKSLQFCKLSRQDREVQKNGWRG